MFYKEWGRIGGVEGILDFHVSTYYLVSMTQRAVMKLATIMMAKRMRMK